MQVENGRCPAPCQPEFIERSISFIEETAADGVDKIRDFCNTSWAGFEWPDIGTYWASDMTTGVYWDIFT
jgi:hypothetical protein